MHTLRFRAQIVTPLFLSGPVPGRPELRAPSVRGALRFWFRAGMGAAGVADPKRLHRLEAALFGDTGRASRVGVAVGDYRGAGPLPGGKTVRWPSSQGFLYLSCQALYKGGARGTTLIRGCYPAGGAFELRLALRPGPEEPVRALLAALWLLAHLGGLGARTRRGYGGLRLEPADDSTRNAAEEAGLAFQPAPGSSVKDHLAQGIDAAVKCLAGYAGTTPAKASGRPPWTSLHGASILLCPDVFGCWQKALERAGDLLIGRRRRAPPDYKAVKAFVVSPHRKPPTVERASFGLPMSFGYRSLMKSTVEREITALLEEGKVPDAQAQAAEIARIGSLRKAAQKLAQVSGMQKKCAESLLMRIRSRCTAHVRGPANETDRRASPLVFRVLPATGAGYRLLAAFLPAEQLFPDGMMRVSRPGRTATLPEPSPLFEAVEAFMKHLRSLGWTPIP